MEIKAEHTISKILKFALIGVLVSLALLWFVGGGVQKIIEQARSFQADSVSGSLSNIFSAGNILADFRLPWQIEMPTLDTQGVSDMPGDPYDTSGLPPGSGIPSPYARDVSIREGAARTQSASGQYIELQSTSGEAIDISGWSLEGLSGTRAYIHEATSLFVMGRVNPVGSVTLGPGGSAIVVTGSSPVGVSFRENMCTGYLGTAQPFTPALNRNCPSPLSVIPRTAENEARLGTACFQYLSQLPSCTFPQNPPATLSPACKSEIQNRLSYNGCVNQYKNSGGFASNLWRLYLAQGKALWRVDHDTVRLLDREGNVVDVLNY